MSDTRWYMYYAVTDDDGKVVYTGHSCVSGLSMEAIEASERGWKTTNYRSSPFREMLVSKGKNWKFHWINTVKDLTAEQARDVMRGNIRLLGYPALNRSKDPQKSHETAQKYRNAV